jgi:mono/diheme cytochrome c family protein
MTISARHRLCGFLLMVAGWLPHPGSALAAAAGGGADLFENHARPVFVAHCIRCHGETKQEAGLNLSTRAGLLAGGDSGPAIVPGNPEGSLLLEALRYESLEMPPTGRLADPLIEGVAAWIAAGAPWPHEAVLAAANPITAEDRSWWCYQPLARPTVPEPPAAQADWCHNEIDRFVVAKLAEQGIEPGPAAPPAVLLRRLSYAVTGLPPREQMLLELDGNQAVLDATATGRLIDELLASPAYGEHQARFWLDLVRYADSDGYRADGARPHAKEYRDYVIRSFNADKPYDRFVMEQLAGDEIDPGDRDALIGTMFLRHWIYEWNQRDVEGQWQKILDDLTETTADVFLAQSLKCARCHDHKFDPLLQQDYYRLQAFFAAFQPHEAFPIADPATRSAHAARQRAWEEATADIRRQLADIERPVLIRHATGQKPTMFPPEIQSMIAKRPEERTPHEHQIAELAARQFEFHPEKLGEQLDEAAATKRQQLLDQLRGHDALKPEPLPTQAFVAGDVGPLAPATFIPDDRSQRPVAPGFLTLLDPAPATIAPPAIPATTGRRTALARWIVSPSNPLTARVIVNRVWTQHFGRGLSSSVNDFGHLGEPPSHPDLLDWLAAWFIREGWSLKKLHRLILTSATFRQASDRRPDAHLTRVDPENRLLWQMSPRRLSGEEINDTILTAGEAVQSVATRKRAIYKTVRRNSPDPLLAAFDLPDRIQSAGERHRTTTPMQALLLANGSWAHDQARMIARRLADRTDREFVETLHRRLFGRHARPDEVIDAEAFLAGYEAITPVDAGPSEAEKLVAMPGKVTGPGNQAVVLSPEGKLAIDLAEVSCLPSADFTVRAVVLLRSLYEDAKVRTIAATWSGNSKEPGWSLGVTSTKSRYQPRNLILQLVGKTEDAENIHYEVVPSNLRLELDRPYFVAVSVDLDDLSSQGITFYLRDLGREDASLQTSRVAHEVNRFIQDGQPLRLGTRLDQHAWHGLVGRLRLDASRLSTAEIENGASRDPVFDWQFTNPAAIGQDASGLGHHAHVLVNTPDRLSPREQSRAALVHILLNANEMLYLD